MEIIEELLDHFRYVHHYDINGNFVIKEIDFNADIDHRYSNQTKLLQYTPDNSYSLYTNRVVVKAEGRNDFIVSYGEERIDQEAGTCGWYGFNQNRITWFIRDGTKRRFSSVRLRVTKRPSCRTIYGTRYGRISVVRQTDEYIMINIYMPDNIEGLMRAITEIGAAAAGLATCESIGGILGGIPIIGGLLEAGSCIFFQLMLAWACFEGMNVLSGMGYWSYEIHGTPIGYVKQTFQQEANDFESQMMLDGMVITEEFEDPLSYTETHCKFVAERSMELIRYQRYGVRCTKVADLRDELLDIIEVPHPYSEQPFKYMLYGLTRRFEKPEIEGGRGTFEDELEGWNLSILRTDISIDP
jgi:hypothetical protein